MSTYHFVAAPLCIYHVQTSVVAYARTDPHRMSYVRTVRYVRYGTVRSVREFNNFIGKGAEVVEYEGTQEKEVIILKYIINIYC
jgi:outer membrane lipoprotein SlyB